MSLPRYPTYRDSGVEWLGDVPAHWSVSRLGYSCAKIGSGKTPLGGADIYSDSGIVFIRSQNVYDEGLRLDDVVYVTSETDADLSTSRVLVGDILINITGASIGRSCVVPDGFGAANVNQHVCILRLAEPEDRAFIAHYMHGQTAKTQIAQLQTGAARDGLNFSQLSNLIVLLPPRTEQRAIAAFLERETAKIDALVAEQRRLMELLKEKRQAVITHAVTKGLEPDVPMKGSGVQWLGDVPAQWDIKRLKHVSPQVTVGIVVEPSKFYVNDGVPALRSLNVAPGEILLEDLVYISPAANELHSKSKLREGDLVAVRSGQPGTTAIIPRELDGCNCIDLLIIRRPREGTERFLCRYLASDMALMQFAIGSGGAIQQHFNVGTASDLIVTVPPAEEQERIASVLDEECARLDRLIDSSGKAISLLIERRAALITAAVTGQIDVREFAPLETA